MFCRNLSVRLLKAGMDIRINFEPIEDTEKYNTRYTALGRNGFISTWINKGGIVSSLTVRPIDNDSYELYPKTIKQCIAWMLK